MLLFQINENEGPLGVFLMLELENVLALIPSLRAQRDNVDIILFENDFKKSKNKFLFSIAENAYNQTLLQRHHICRNQRLTLF